MTNLPNKHVIRLLSLGLLFFGIFAIGEPLFDKLLTLAEKRYGSKGAKTVSQWQILIESKKSSAEPAKLIAINDFFNERIRFSIDQEIWGHSDYWATPLETMGVQQGDCEDFSIAKYISLIKLGVPINKLRLVYVKAQIAPNQSQAHMVLAYYPTPTSDPLILDNLNMNILPASQRRDLTPVFSFNSAGLWVGNATQPKLKKPETRLSRWRDVLIRMQIEGLQ